MQQLSDLQKKIGIIVSQANAKTPVYQWVAGPRPEDFDPDTFLAEPGSVELVCEPVIVLKALYASTPPTSRPEFVSALRFYAMLVPAYAEVVVQTLIEIGKLSEIKPILSPGVSNEAREAIWTALAHKIAMEPHTFADADLTLVEDLLGEEFNRPVGGPGGIPGGRVVTPRPPIRRAASLVRCLRYLRLKDELLEAHNPEINADREVLVSRMEKLGFRKEIAEALDEVERRLLAAGKPLDFKGCMDLVRTVYEKMFEDAAKAAAKKVPRPLPAGPHVGPFQPWYQYLENVGCLTTDEGAVAQKLYNYLSNAGSHQLGSAPEQVRVTKNVVIEFGLMMVGRVQGLARSIAPATPGAASTTSP